jgi:hypothetical protein
MTINVTWDDPEHTIIRYEFNERWTWPELLQAVAQSDAMLMEAGHVCHFIYDIRLSRAIPDSALTYLKRFVGKKRANTGIQVVVGNDKSRALALAESLLSVLQKLYNPDWGLFFAESLDEAHERLAERARQSQAP